MYKFIFIFIALVVPAISFADDFFLFSGGIPAQPNNFSEIVCLIVKLSLDFVPYLVVIAVGAFIQGLIKYVGNGDNEEKRSEGRKMMIYGVLGFFFMVSVWGVLSIFTNSFGVTLAIPQFKAATSPACYSARL